MRLVEFAPTKLSSLMAFLANKIEGDNKEMPMKAFIAMGQKMGLPLSYPAIKKAYDENLVLIQERYYTPALLR